MSHDLVFSVFFYFFNILGIFSASGRYCCRTGTQRPGMGTAPVYGDVSAHPSGGGQLRRVRFTGRLCSTGTDTHPPPFRAPASRPGQVPLPAEVSEDGRKHTGRLGSRPRPGTVSRSTTATPFCGQSKPCGQPTGKRGRRCPLAKAWGRAGSRFGAIMPHTFGSESPQI